MTFANAQPGIGASASITRRERSRIPLFGLLFAWLLAMAMVFGIAANRADSDGRGLFRDTDDAMRAVQVLDWIDGAAWSDLRQPRLAPPAGVDMHWSRLPDIPIAAAIVIAEPVLGRDRALTLAAVLVPSLLLLGTLAAIAWAGIPFGPAPALVAPVLAALCPPLLAKFSPGALDHHNWQILLTALLVGATLRLVDERQCPRKFGAAAVAAVAGAAGLWVGGEMLPWIAVIHAALALEWVIGQSHRNHPIRTILPMAMAAGMALLTATLLWGALPAGGSLPRVCDAVSPAYVAVAASGVPFWLVLAGWQRIAGGADGRGRRATVAAMTAAAVGAAFLSLFPECRGGPMGAVPLELQTAWLSRVSEARGLISFALASPAAGVQYCLLPAIGLAVCLWHLRAVRRADAPLWRMKALLLVSSVVLALVQARVLTFANLFAILPATWLLIWLWQRLEPALPPVRAIARAALVLAFTPLPYLAALGPSEASGAPAERSLRRCDAGALGEAIASDRTSTHPDGAPALVASFIDLGPALLLEGGLSVLGAPYHRNVDGNLDLIRIMTAPPDEAQRVIRRRGVDYVAVCVTMAEADWYAADGPEGLAARLAPRHANLSSKTPDWLIVVPTPGDPDLRLFRVGTGAGPAR